MGLSVKKYQTTFQADRIHASAFIAAGAVVVGDVTVSANASVWFNAILRGDAESLTIGEGSNIQDGAIGHADPGQPLIIGSGVSVGHRAIVHGARIGDGSLIGMGAIVMNGARIGKGCLVGAGALVTQRKSFPDHTLILGNPARAIRELTEDELAELLRTANEYVAKARAFKAQTQTRR